VGRRFHRRFPKEISEAGKEPLGGSGKKGEALSFRIRRRLGGTEVYSGRVVMKKGDLELEKRHQQRGKEAKREEPFLKHF